MQVLFSPEMVLLIIDQKKKKGKFQLTQNWGGKKYFTGHRCGHYFH